MKKSNVNQMCSNFVGGWGVKSKYCQAPGPVQCPGQGPVRGPGQGLNSELKIQCQILKRKDLERHYNQTGHPTPPPPNFLKLLLELI